MIKKLLKENYEADIILALKELFVSNSTFSSEDISKLKNYDTEDYALIGIIGLILKNKARILLGKKQPFDIEIKQWCEQIEVSLAEMEEIAMKFLDDDFSEEQEIILRKVMLEYPKNSSNIS